MDNLQIDVKYAQKISGKWKDTERRSEHIFDKMRRLGISIRHIKDAVIFGTKSLSADGRISSDFKWFRVVYREFKFKRIRKIYPITVYEA